MAASAEVARKASTLAVEGDWKPLTGFRLGLEQIFALTRKNVFIRSRAWKTNLILVLQAALFMMLTWGIDVAVKASNQRRPAFSSVPVAHPKLVGPIPDCADNMFMRKNKQCYTLLYAPKGVPEVDEIVAAVAARNEPPIPSQHVKGFANGSSIDVYLLEHWNTVLAAVEFVVDSPQSIGFSLMTNSSVQWFKGKFQDPNLYAQLPVQVAIEREIARRVAGPTAVKDWQVHLTEFPHSSSKSPSAIGALLPTFLFASIMFGFVLQLHDVLVEKESGVRRLMQVMGLRDSSYWASWYMWQGLLAVTEASLLFAFSYAFSFVLVTENDPRLGYLLFLGVSMSMTAFAFFVAAFLRKAAVAVPAGFFIFIVAWVTIVVVNFGFPYRPAHSKLAQAVFNAFPWTLLAKGVEDLAAATDGQYTGITWSDRNAYCHVATPSPEEQQALSYWQMNCVLSLGQIYRLLFLQTCAYLALALYFDNVLKDEHGTKRAPWYFLIPTYWWPRLRSKKSTARAVAALAALNKNASIKRNLLDPDVSNERATMKVRCEQYVRQQASSSSSSPSSSSQTPHDSHQAMDPASEGQETRSHDRSSVPYALEMYGLRKEYPISGLFRRKKPFVAVEEQWLGIQSGECFCLLGPNGAGKTTTIHCLTGVLPFTRGEALVYGNSIATPAGLDAARPLIGICPQFDTGLWDHLTGREHLQLFASIKGLPRKVRSIEADLLLEEVKLTEAGNITAGAYSGGMKRRLSVSLALLGDPKVVYLDEPTTGLDPISRRHLWDLIDKAKRGRAIVLTTHSMEEADILGDRIGIMVRGSLRCIGTSLRLKSRFGSGYCISVRVTSATSNGNTMTSAADAGSSNASYATSTAPRLLPTTSSTIPYSKEKEDIKAVFMRRLGVTSSEESHDYLHFMVPYEHEDKLPLLLAHLKAHASELGVEDVQLRLTPLEEVFLNVTRKAELEAAEAEGRFEMLVVSEEKIAVKVPLGAEFIKTPNGNFYHLKWIQDDHGRLKLQDYWQDPINTKIAKSDD